MGLSCCSSWPKLSLHYTEINNIMYVEKTLYRVKAAETELYNYYRNGVETLQSCDNSYLNICALG